jgi:hypothetical protein
MAFKIINRYRHSASPLAGEVGSVEPLPSAASVARAHAASFLFSAIIAGLLLGAASGAWAAPIPGLFNTGTDASGNALGGGNGVTDPHYTVVTSIEGFPTNVSAVTFRAGSYLPDDADSRWVSHSSDGFPGFGSVVIRLTFDLTGLNPSSAVISGDWGVDNFGEIFLNGLTTGITYASFGGLSSFTISDGFLAGVNNLDFRVTDFGPPLGLRVDNLVGTADTAGGGGPAPVPAPGSLAMFGFAAAATCLRRWLLA